MNNFKTIIYLALLTGLMLVVGQLVGGHTGMMVMFLISLVMNFVTYWYSDTMVLKAYNAIQISEHDNPELYRMVQRLAKNGNMPMPKVYIINSDVPNAFATGRDPKHAAVAVTTGIMRLLNDDEIEGVLGHELTHVKHRDTLISTVAASIAGFIAMVANVLQWTAIFGGRDDRENSNPFVLLATIVLLPIAASLIQMGISRSREYLADEGGAEISGKPLALASALAKIEIYATQGALPNSTPETAHMFIINPLSGRDFSFSSLFSTHPPTKDRIAKLKEMAVKYSR